MVEQNSPGHREFRLPRPRYLFPLTYVLAIVFAWFFVDPFVSLTILIPGLFLSALAFSLTGNGWAFAVSSYVVPAAALALNLIFCFLLGLLYERRARELLEKNAWRFRPLAELLVFLLLTYFLVLRPLSKGAFL